jgi:hypothetical protein
MGKLKLVLQDHLRIYRVEGRNFSGGRVDVLLILLGLFFFAPATFAQTEATSSNATLTNQATQSPDSSALFPQKKSAKSTWEKIVSFPGQVLYLPVGLVFALPAEIASLAFQGKFLAQVTDFLVADDSSRGVYPVYDARRGGGVKYFQRGLIFPNSYISLTASGGPLRRQHYAFKYRQFFSRTSKLELIASYTNLPNEFFYGIGNGSFNRDKTNYAHEFSNVSADFAIGFNEKIWLDLSTGVDFNNIFDGRGSKEPLVRERHDTRQIPGFENKIEFWKLLANLSVDNRNHPGSPTAGWQASFGGGIFREIGDEKYDHYRLNFDITKYLHLFYRRTLVLRVASRITRPFSGREVPFLYMSHLGKEESIRGFQRGRFRDRDMVLGSVEYRWPVFRIIDALLFFDFGKVSNNVLGNSLTTNLQSAYGFGFRLWGQNGMLARFQLGKSDDGIRLYFKLNE